MNDENRCEGWIPGVGLARGHRCSRDAKPGEKLCGQHLAGKRRSEKIREQNDAMAKQNAQRHRDREALAKMRAARLSVFGLTANSHWVSGVGATGDIVLSGPEADKLIALLEASKP